MKSLLKLSVSTAVSFLLLWLILGEKTLPRTTQAQEPIGATAAARDDEIVLLDSIGRVVVVDPYVPVGYRRVEFTSEQSGWTRVATGDVNGDGDDEVIAFKSTGVWVYDPVVPKGGTAVNATVVAGSNWTDIAVGDFDYDGRDEIALLNDAEIGDYEGHIYVYDGGSSGASWALHHYTRYLIPWEHIAVGSFDTTAGEDIAVCRYDDGESLLSLRRGSNTSYTISEKQTVGRWESLVGGQVVLGTSQSEVLATRNTSSSGNFYVFNYNLTDLFVTQEASYFLRVAAGDINGDGDDEAVLWRHESSTEDLKIYNPTFLPALLSLNTNASWRGMATGDVDGDGRDEVILAHSDKYRIYNSLESSVDFTDYTGGSWRDSWDPIATGNIDGNGVPIEGVEMDIQIGEELTAPIFIQHSYASASNPVTWTTLHSPTTANWFTAIPTSDILTGSGAVTYSVLITGDMLSVGTHQAELLIVFRQTTTTTVQTSTMPIKAIVSWPSMSVVPPNVAFSIVATDATVSFTKTVEVTQRQGPGHGVLWEAHSQGGSPMSALDFPLPGWLSVSPPLGTQSTTPSTLTLIFTGKFTTAQSPYQAGILIMAPFTVTSNTQQVLIRVNVAGPSGPIYLPLVLKGSS
jgi:hypothetical protein